MAAFLRNRSYSDYLYIHPSPGRIDAFVETALNAVEDVFKQQDELEAVRQRIEEEGLASPILKVTRSLNQRGLEPLVRNLLARRRIYLSLIGQVLGENVDVRDTTGFAGAVLRRLEDRGGPRDLFVRTLTSDFLSSNYINLPDALARSFQQTVASRRLPLTPGRPVPVLENLLRKLRAQGELPALINGYIASGEVEPANFTPTVRAAMAQRLKELGVRFDSTATTGERSLDEYFALAYSHALDASRGGDDPIIASRTKGSLTAWDFQVDYFDGLEEQGVIAKNIKAAGAIDYVWELGEQLSIFKLADSLVLNWAAGTVDVVDGEAASKLYSYWKLRDERSSPEERGMLYRRVLNKGSAKVLDRAVVNEHFPRLWDQLMKEVALYIQKVETSEHDDSVSRRPIYQATRALQHNLTEFGTGMSHMQVTEIYAQLQEAIEILGHPEILDHFGGGRRKTLWTVIERLSKQELGRAPNIAALRDVAVEGNKIFQWVANFDAGTVSDDAFQGFLFAAEAYILAKGQAESADIDEEEDDFGDDFDDDFDDFDEGDEQGEGDDFDDDFDA